VADGLVVLLYGQAGKTVLRDVEHNRDLWTRRCRSCAWIGVSADGSRAAHLGVDGLEIWDAAPDRVLFTETARLNGLQTTLSLSPDGKRVAWSEASVVHLRDLDSGRERTLRLDGSARQLGFSPDSRQLGVVTTGSVSVWDAAEGQALWTVLHSTSDKPFELHWSVDERTLMVQYEALGTELIDARTGDWLARLPGTRAGVLTVRPDLGAKVVNNEANWELRPLPGPARDSPAESLASTLKKTGLALKGVDVVAAP